MAKKKKSNTSVSNLLIKTYGLFWKKDDVFWGTPGKGKAGSLSGSLTSSKKSKIVDFREQTGIYVLYADYKIIYIGQAGNGHANLFTRLRKHLTDDLSQRWDRFSWFGLQQVRKTDNCLVEPNKSVHVTQDIILNHIEAILIHASEPPLNRQGGRWSKKVEQYIQHRDESTLGPDDMQMIKVIYDNSKSLIKSGKVK